MPTEPAPTVALEGDVPSVHLEITGGGQRQRASAPPSAQVPAAPAGLAAPPAATPHDPAARLELRPFVDQVQEVAREIFREELHRFGLTPEELARDLSALRQALREQQEAVHRRAVELGLLPAAPGGEAPAFRELRQALTAPRPKPPDLGAYQLPAPPSTAPRPWLDAESQPRLVSVIGGLSLLASMAAGLAGGAPVAALRAFTGALEGWQAGDRERAQRRWQEYLGEVDRIRHALDLALKQWDIAVKEHGANLAAAEASFRSRLLEHELFAKDQQLRTQPLAMLLQIYDTARETTKTIMEQSARLAEAEARTWARHLADLHRQVSLQLALNREAREQQLFPWRLREAQAGPLREVFPEFAKLEANRIGLVSIKTQAEAADQAVERLWKRGYLAPSSDWVTKRRYALKWADPTRPRDIAADFDIIERNLKLLEMLVERYGGATAQTFRFKMAVETLMQDLNWASYPYLRFVVDLAREVIREAEESIAVRQQILERIAPELKEFTQRTPSTQPPLGTQPPPGTQPTPSSRPPAFLGTLP